jgi:DNA modification methylase
MSEYHQRIKKQGQFEFSFEPKSFWEYIRGGVLDKIIGDSKSYGETYTGKVPIHKGRHNEGGFLSKFNSEYAKRIIEMWSKEEDSILDPFAGRSSRSLISVLLNRNYLGFDVVDENLNESRVQYEEFKNDYNKIGRLKLIHSSSEFIDDFVKQDECVDLIFTCPPYFNIERYESTPGQLTDFKTYEEFFENYKTILNKCIPKLKPTGFFIVVLANFRVDNKFYDFCGDTKNILKEHLDFHDEIILEMSPAKRHPLYLQAITNLNCLKTHEYCIVFRNSDMKENIIKRNDEINENRPLVKDVYEDKDRLFWSKSEGKIDWIEQLFQTKNNSLQEFFKQ